MSKILKAYWGNLMNQLLKFVIQFPLLFCLKEASSNISGRDRVSQAASQTVHMPEVSGSSAFARPAAAISPSVPSSPARNPTLPRACTDCLYSIFLFYLNDTSKTSYLHKKKIKTPNLCFRLLPSSLPPRWHPWPLSCTFPSSSILLLHLQWPL